jgi:Putative homoserine kinase type II (protein kinase fold)
MNDIKRFLDDSGRVKIWPVKRDIQSDVLNYVASKFDSGRLYTEKEVNTLIENWHTFGDLFLIRRGLVDFQYLSRARNGSKYWKEEIKDNKDISQLVISNYKVGSISGIARLSSGYGSNSYYILSDKGEFIFKDIDINGMNHPEHEATILAELWENNVPVSEIYPANSGETVLKANNRVYHLQKYIDGKIYGRNTAPEWLLSESARMLGKIQKTMEKLPLLPNGLSQSFFDYMTPERAKSNNETTLKLAYEKEDTEIVNAIKYKMKMLDSFGDLNIEVNKMTCKNTHGDYKIQQIICGRDKINAVIDFTSACVHPICWEIIRAYISADKGCAYGNIDIDNLKEFVSCFLEFGNLNTYDLKMMPYIYFYQILVSDYFGQYYKSESRNRNLILEEAFFSLNQCKWLEQNIDKLEYELTTAF